MRFTRGDVRDHIVSSKIDHGPPWWRGKATQQQRSPKIDFREIFRVVRFSTAEGQTDAIGPMAD